MTYSMSEMFEVGIAEVLFLSLANLSTPMTKPPFPKPQLEPTLIDFE